MFFPFQRTSRWFRGLASQRIRPWHKPLHKQFRMAVGLLALVLVAARAPTALPRASARPDENGAAIYIQACAMCHDRSGTGNLPFGPALAAAPWLRNCPEDHVAAIILDGVYGNIPGTTSPYPVMAALRTWLNDQQIADVSNHVLHRWGGRAGGVTPERVRALRGLQPLRTSPWSLNELSKIPNIYALQVKAAKEAWTP